MSVSIDQSFIDAFDADTKLAYQRMGPKLRRWMRVVTNVRAKTHRFPTLGKGVANTKGRHADLTPMNLQHGNQTATLTDHYAPEFLDDLDMFKTNQDTRRDYAESAAAAIGRKNDELALIEWEASAGSTILAAGAGLTKAKILEANELLNDNDVPMGADSRVMVIGSSQNTDLLQINEAVSIDFAAGKMLVDGKPTNSWMGFSWLIHTGLPVTTGGTPVRSCFAAHDRASGLAIGRDIQTNISFIEIKDSWLVKSKMSMGATVIDSQGIIKIECEE